MSLTTQREIHLQLLRVRGENYDLRAALEDVDDYLDESNPDYFPVPEVIRGIVYAALAKAKS